MALSTKKVLTHVRLQQMAYNEKGNLSRLLGAIASSGIPVPSMRGVILSAVKRADPNIIDATEDQNWHRVRIHGVDLERYSRELRGI